ncbi:hypothetical protein WA026_020271 [Henosepilachna vigintioctopunctata]|uniref:U3 small nucleolar RNA-associated protein 18 homolog n=1 Tax=Henosepilachna vigintioctopunctata TaxID=420089 RepID=A0AAW1TX02_9CUCU
MSKSTRKRKHDKEVEIEYQMEIPKPKHRPYDFASQVEDEHLTQILFGGSNAFLKSLEEAEQEEIKAHPDSGLGEEDSDDFEMEHKPAWTDDDDDGIEVGQALDAQGRHLPDGGINSRSNKYKDLLKHKFQSINSIPKWAKMSKFSEDSDEDEILQTCGFIKKQRGSFLPSSILEYKKMKDLNSETYTEGPFINSIEFLNNSSVALVAGQNGIATLFAVDGKKNAKLHSIGFEHFSICCAKVIEKNNEIIFGSRHSYIHSFNMMSSKSNKIPLPPGLTTFKNFIVSHDDNFIAATGKWGEIHLLSSKSKERIGILKQSGEVTSLCFNPNNNLLYSHSDSGEITIFDLSMRRVKHKFIDEGCLQGTTITISPSNQFVAAGSAQGVVNIYDSNSVLEKKNPTPRKSLMNLTTGITSLEFNPTSEMLAFSSVDVLNSVKLYHVNSSTTFKNFPSFETRFGHVNVVKFSPGSGYMALGNKKSTVSLYRLGHFKNY